METNLIRSKEIENYHLQDMHPLFAINCR